jgi:putative MATE family efflux protein
VPDADASTRRLMSLAASAFVVLAAEPLYVLVDTAVVGHLGTVPLAGLGVGAALLTLVVIVGTFVEYGTTGRAARAYGSGDLTAALDEGVQASWIAVLVGLAVILVGELFAHPLTRLLAGGVGPTQQAAESWFRIAVIGVPGILLVLAGNGWMRGVQETRAPVKIVLLANGISAVALPFLVFTAGYGLRGSAIANVVAQTIGAALFLRALHRRADGGLRPNAAVMRAQAVVGRDLILRQVGFQVAFLTAAAVAARMGTAQIAAHQIGLQLWEFTALLLDSFAIAAQSLVGFALGAAAVATARSTAWRVSRYGLWAGLCLAVVFAAGWSVIPAIFTSSEAVRAQAHILWPWFVAMLPVAGVVFALDGVLIGAGDVAFMRTITLVAAVCFFAPLNLLALRLGWGIGGVWAGLAAFIAVRFVGMVLRVRGTRWLVTGHAPAR